MSALAFEPGGTADPIALAFFDRALFALPPKRIVAEDNPGTGRAYLIDKKTGRVLAVGNVPEGCQ